MVFTCPVCDNEEYTEDDGAFYCTECGTQSQDYFVVEASAPDILTPGAVRHEVARTKVEGTRKKIRPSLGRPWTLYEAYQIIILAQADALIAQGASKDLKDVVYTVWANYLSSIGIAFCRKERIVPDIVERYKIGRPREICRGTFEKPRNRRKQPIEVPEKGRGKKRTISETNDGEDLANATGQTQEELVDPSSNTIFMDDSVFINSEEKHFRIRNHVHNSPAWMNIKKTIAICYIGVKFTNPDILPCDVVRWIYEGRVPYLSTSHLLPDEMVLSNRDSDLFCVERFTADTLILEVNRITSFLQLRDMPAPDLNVLASRFIKELCLPNEFNRFIQRLIRKIPWVWNLEKTAHRRHEILALAYIILALKIVFGLNDSCEKKMTEQSQELQTVLGNVPCVFIWSEWKSFLTQKQHLKFDAYREFTSDISTNKVENLDQLLGFHSNLNHSKKRLSVRYLLASNGMKARHNDPQFRDTLAKPLSAALASLNFTSQDETRAQCERIDTKGEEFRESTVSHLVDLSTFEDKVKLLGKDKNPKCQELLGKISSNQPKFVLYSYPTCDSELNTDRHRSYRWLLEITSKISHCQELILDKAVARLSEYFVRLSKGDPMEGIMCSSFGFFAESKSKRRRKQYNLQ